MTFATSGCLGVDFTQKVAGTGTSSDEGAEFALGTTLNGSNGTKWMYVHAATAITQYDAVGVSEDYEASALTKAMADDGWTIGFAQVAASDNDFFWLAIEGRGNISVRCAGSCAADVSLYTTASAGKLDDTSASQTKIQGVVGITASTSAAHTKEIIAISPHVDLPA